MSAESEKFWKNVNNQTEAVITGLRSELHEATTAYARRIAQTARGRASGTSDGKGIWLGTSYLSPTAGPKPE